MAPCNAPLSAIVEEPLLESLFPDRAARETLASQIVRKLRAAIEDGTFPIGTRLLGTRHLSQRLGVGRNTVAIAYEQLMAEGYLEARVGAGTFIARSGVRHPRTGSASARTLPKAGRKVTGLLSYFEYAAGHGPLRPGMPDLSQFPLRSWKSAAGRALSAYDGDRGYCHASGMRELREAIALHVRQFRGIATGVENIIVVEGAQAAFSLAAAVLASPGESIAIEDPCYGLARAAFEERGLRLHGVSVDDQGMIVERIPASAALAFVTPSHQFPMGGILPLARRVALLDWARSNHAYVVEDDYDSEFTLNARPLPALQSLDRDGSVIYVGSFSKTLAPFLRLGYLISPPHLARAFRAARASTSVGVGIHLQATMADFISRGHLARHIQRVNRLYERRRSALIDALRPALSTAFRLGPSQTGLHVALIGPSRFNDVKFATSIEGQRFVSLSQLCVRRSDCRGFVLGFASHDETAVGHAAAKVGKMVARIYK